MKQSTKQINNQYELNRKKTSLKNMYFNRFLLIRYLLAIFVFSNFYWSIFSSGTFISIIPIMLLLLSCLAAYEMFKVLGQKDPIIHWTHLFFKLQMIVCGVGMIVLITFPVSEIIPFLTNTSLAQLIGFILFGSGFFMCLLVRKRLHQIELKSDKQYQRIQYYEKTLKINL